MSIYYLTKKKLEEIEQEYENLKKAKRENFSQAAPSFFEGEDLNPDFAFYEENMEGLNARVEELEAILKNHVIITRPEDKDKVSLGASVVLKENLSKEQQFKIVGTLEANPFEGKISDESPAGRAFLGKRVGDTVSVGANLYKILKINYEEV
jgi:transcription elongation factor GreA